MTSSPKADQWLAEYRLDDGESLRDVLQRLWREPGAFYMVVRCEEIDYAFRPGRFRLIRDPDDYHFLRSGYFMSMPHGAAPKVAMNLLMYIQAECNQFPGAVIDEIPGAGRPAPVELVPGLADFIAHWKATQAQAQAADGGGE